MKILFAVADSGCAYWRSKLPCRMIEKQGLAETRIFNSNMSQSEMDSLVAWADVVVTQSTMGIPMVSGIANMQQMGKAVIGDYDDLSFSLSPFNPSYKTLGINEVKVTVKNEEHYIWKDGIDGFSIKANYFRYKSLQDILKMLNVVTTTGQYIKNRYLEFNKNIIILPNSIDFDLFKPFPPESSGQVRIGWTPSDSHYSEIWMIKRIMRRVLDKYGDKVKLVILGNLFELHHTFTASEMERHDFIGLEVYPMKLASLQFDIGLCPLDNNDFNRAKSQLKWSEYSSLRIPSVCSKLEPYDCVDDGVTGLLADDEDDFFNKICILVENSELRRKIADNSYDKNYEDFNLENNAILWVDACEQAKDKSCEPQLLDKEALVKDTPRTSQT